MAEITPQSILFGLPMLQWRGLDMPHYDSAPIQVQHTQSERRFPYIDGAGHDHTGRDPIRMNLRLFFINTLSLRSGVRLFPDLFEEWKEALLDGSAGDLRHPILGPVRARVMNFGVELDANKSLAGVIVNVTWVDTVDDPAQQTDFLPLENNVTAIAADVDAIINDLDIPKLETDKSLASLFQQIDGFVFSAGLSISGLLNQNKGLIESFIDRIERLNDPNAFPGLDQLKLLYASVLDAQELLGAGTSRSTSTILFPFPTTLTAAAGEVSNTVEELMSLNLALLRAPQVPPGTAITFYTE